MAEKKKSRVNEAGNYTKPGMRKRMFQSIKAGSSGGPWLIHSQQIGDVLVGITHGGGFAPQVAYAATWIQESVSRHSNDRLMWATKKQTLGH